MTWVRVQMRINCTECGMTVPVNGPLRTIHCDNCQTDIEFGVYGWKSVIESLREDTRSKPGKIIPCTIFDQFDTKLLSVRMQPSCPQCKTNLENAALESGKSFSCPGCQKTLSSVPFPELLRKFDPSASLLFNAMIQEGPINPEPQSAKPVLFSCLQCGAPLKVDGTSRILTCGACDTDCYLPDPLWLRLHPAQVMQRWYVGFGKVAAGKEQGRY